MKVSGKKVITKVLLINGKINGCRFEGEGDIRCKPIAYKDVTSDIVALALSTRGMHTHYLREKQISKWDSYDWNNFKSICNKY